MVVAVLGKTYSAFLCLPVYSSFHSGPEKTDLHAYPEKQATLTFAGVYLTLVFRLHNIRIAKVSLTLAHKLIFHYLFLFRSVLFNWKPIFISIAENNFQIHRK